MDRRKSLKALVIGTVSTTVLIDACKNEPAKTSQENVAAKDDGFNKAERQPEEIDRLKSEMSATYFTPHEMATITVLGDIIIPKDEISGSASEAKVPDFIEFIVKDMPHYKVPMRGGLRWIDMQSLNLFDNSFKDLSATQQLQIVDSIAYPEKVKPELKQGAAFFSMLRNLVATGFYTSEIGVKDMGYVGNTATRWNGVPDDVLKQYGLAYSEKELKECVSF
jgi:gluconate 2-dehydrogenase gamma chain